METPPVRMMNSPLVAGGTVTCARSGARRTVKMASRTSEAERMAGENARLSPGGKAENAGARNLALNGARHFPAPLTDA